MSHKTISIFLASSNELKAEREEFERFIGRENNRLIEKDIYLRLQIWEDFVDAMAIDGLQSEYNKAVRKSDIFVMLYFTKVGKYTDEEFEAAYSAFKENGKPLIYTFFKNAAINVATVKQEDLKALWAFQEKLKALKHYQTVYQSTEDLLLQFKKQLDKILDEPMAENTMKQSHTGSGDNVGGSKIGRQINMGANSTYIENPGAEVAPPPPLPSAPAKQKILFLAASPDDRDRLKVEKEYRSIQAQMGQGREREKYEFLQPQFGVTVDALIRSMSDLPQIVHFSGHGGADGIVIATDDGKSKLISVGILRRVFKPLQGIGQVVLLNACYSAPQSEEISKLGLYVVGNNQPVTDEAALEFAKGLYIGLGAGKSFEAAYNDGIIAVMAVDEAYEKVYEVWKDGVKLDL